MKRHFAENIEKSPRGALTWIIGIIIWVMVCPFNIFSENPQKPQKPTRNSGRTNTVMPDTIPVGNPIEKPTFVLGEELTVTGDTVSLTPTDEVPVMDGDEEQPAKVFNPDPSRAVWLSVLCPGLGQIYNRRYWKLPIVIGGFVGLGYATSWNNGMLRDYTRAYSDLLDSDPNTKSYMDFFPSTTKEEDLNRTWLENTFKARKDYYRRNRDLCIICMVGVYLLAAVDAYVDATLTHFDISPDLSMQLAPALIPDSRNVLPGVGLQWAINF